MKNLYLILFVAVLFISCSDEEKMLELFSPEAFAFSLDSGWEVNASVQVKGFSQKEVNSEFALDLKYQVDIELPNGELVTKVDVDQLSEKNSEEFIDYGIDSQIELDSNFVVGKYKLTFTVIDNFSRQKAVIATEFDITE